MRLNITLPVLFLISLGYRDVIPGCYRLETCLGGDLKTHKNLKGYSRSQDPNFSSVLSNCRPTGS